MIAGSVAAAGCRRALRLRKRGARAARRSYDVRPVLSGHRTRGARVRPPQRDGAARSRRTDSDRHRLPRAGTARHRPCHADSRHQFDDPVHHVDREPAEVMADRVRSSGISDVLAKPNLDRSAGARRVPRHSRNGTVRIAARVTAVTRIRVATPSDNLTAFIRTVPLSIVLV